ncbi:NAD(P)H-dependent oxidoreductase [Ensifer sp. MJa1]|uniref:NAD(P)H-dependent oxidoreductase n=1 Tax=Ensifer sp. MJa1 TaxID=2919888 RepID=UPI003009F6B1
MAGTLCRESGVAKAEIELGENVLEEFLAAETVVLGVPQYNFSVPSQLKAWIDRIAAPGKTFRYTARELKAWWERNASSSPWPAAAFVVRVPPPRTSSTSYLKSVFAFIGIANPEVITDDGVNVSSEQHELSLKAARARIAELKSGGVPLWVREAAVGVAAKFAGTQ